MIKNILYLLILSFANLLSQNISTPLEKSNFSKLTSYEELKNFIHEVDDQSDLIRSEVLTKSVEGRELFAVFFSKGEFGVDNNKLKVLIFAQQHGNEQSGKEGALKLIRDVIKAENNYLFEKIDLIIIPQMNPDGSEKSKRRNGNDVDLNRNHSILTEPETIALHKLFNQHLFEVTLDVHEYFPYSESWEQFGIYKSADEQLGLLTNLNVSQKIRNYSKEKALPYIKNYLKERSFTFCEYIVGGPPNKERMRHSTVDINDGRQSFGIQNTLSFILEGKNGRDYAIDNIKHRTEAQYSAMMGILKFVYDNADDIKLMVRSERDILVNSDSPVVLRMDHYNQGEKFILPVEEVQTGVKKVFEVDQYYSEVRSIYQIPIPDAYLVPKNDSLLMNILANHQIKFSSDLPEYLNLEQYFVTSIDSITLEDEAMAAPKFKVIQKNLSDLESDYVLVPTNQIKKNLIVAAFEIRSMHALYHYDIFKYMINQEDYPIIRAYKD